MKKIITTLSFLILLGCSSTRFVDSWKNNKIPLFKPNKILVIGITDNLTARKLFEEKLKKKLLDRGMNAEESMLVIDKMFTSTKRTENEIDELIKGLYSKGYDAVIINTLKGVEEKRKYSDNFYDLNYNWTPFTRYYFRFQDIYFTPQYYEEYKVYHIETSIYNINVEENKSLVWVGAFNIVNPQSMKTVINDYTLAVIKQLEKEHLIN
ncbi:hypothetical protein ACFQZW_12350 [Lutibacter aestuarii]|uniref:Cardiolipin synthetase n=1 Tax=Lutibacter aestuarii TaxID=861111 RepID=A0ABW2ZA55_9FLAO|nr:hypothetical protein [uncultured Lutibacter sp.]